MGGLTNANTRVHNFDDSLSRMFDAGELHNGDICGEERGESDSGYIRNLVSRVKKNHGESIPSVMIPRVPSAPMNSLVTSKPADDFLDLWRVLIISPLGRTTVWRTSQS